MKIKVIGKQHMQGISKKSGNPYDFICVYFVDRVQGGVGERGEQINLDPALYDFNLISVGKEYEVEFGRYNRIEDFREVK